MQGLLGYNRRQMQPFQDLCGPASPLDWSTILTRAQTIVQILALVLGGGWAYFRYVKGRTFKPRVEPAVSGTIFERNDDRFIVVTVSLKNVGLSRVPIQQEGTFLSVSTCQESTGAFLDMKWSDPLGFALFTEHAWIEPGEPIEDKAAFQLPSDQIAVRLKFHLVSTKLRWSAGDIIPLTTKPKTEVMAV